MRHCGRLIVYCPKTMKYQCQECPSSDIKTISVYKRYWHFCNVCGSATTQKKQHYRLSWLPYKSYKKDTQKDEANMYDYFADDAHVQWSIEDGKELLMRYIDPYPIKLDNSKVLDISGGNGHALNQLVSKGAKGELTEINDIAISYAKKNFDFPVYKFNLNEHSLLNIGEKLSYDVIMTRACVMFCDDIDKLIAEIYELLKPGGYYILNNTIVPTLGLMLRTQFDEYSFHILRQTSFIADKCINAGFKLVEQVDEVDPSMYAYDNDFLKEWRFAHYLYEIKAINQLEAYSKFDLRARDRRRSTLILQK